MKWLKNNNIIGDARKKDFRVFRIRNINVQFINIIKKFHKKRENNIKLFSKLKINRLWLIFDRKIVKWDSFEIIFFDVEIISNNFKFKLLKKWSISFRKNDANVNDFIANDIALFLNVNKLRKLWIKFKKRLFSNYSTFENRLI